jgi:hypothetical protein
VPFGSAFHSELGLQYHILVTTTIVHVQARVKLKTSILHGKRLQTQLDEGCAVSTLAEVQWMNLHLLSNFLTAFQKQQDSLKAYADAVTQQAGQSNPELVLHPKQLKQFTDALAKLRQDKRYYDAAFQPTQEDIAAQGQKQGGECKNIIINIKIKEQIIICK